MQYLMCILVLQLSRGGRESWLFYLDSLLANKCLLLFHSTMRVAFMFSRDRLDLAVLLTPSTQKRHSLTKNRNQVRWYTCAGVRGSTPSSEVV